MNNLFIILLLFSFLSRTKEALKSAVVLKKEIPKVLIQPEGKPTNIDSTLLLSFNNKVLTNFYKATNYRTVWQSEEKRKIILEELKRSDEEGLQPEDYNLKVLFDFEKKAPSLDSLDLAKYDILLTSSLQKYIAHLTNGTVNPRKLYKNWDLKENYIDLNTTVIHLLKSDSLVYKIEQLKPNHIVYKRLKKALQLLNNFPKDNFKSIKFTKIITPNDTSTSIIDIKKRLIYWKDMQPNDSLTPIYDQETVVALKRFQSRHGLAADAKIGLGTVAALNFSKKQRSEQIIANLERWKWYPKQMGQEYLIINIPDYKLLLVKNKDTLRTHRVIVGRIKRKTPILSSTLTQVVFNPTWTVPPTILKEDVIPAILRSRAYLTQSNIMVYDATGRFVSPYEWQLSQAYTYRYVQSPGTFNSLGMVKLIFPNRFSVYLHDTNHRDYFEKIDRSLSSGCVRVENPLELTEYLLSDAASWNLEKITETLQKERTKFVKIKKEVAIHLLYWTAWSENGKLIFRDDIYNLDANLYDKLRN
ncbi:Murein L,D-transpeptidase YcbB/YkuD [Flavobacterium fryxellicola]|uniref:Peptidoglycan-binding protein n=1 Tax=Flavobacterium fryxellicola TaxID=249352 RepID=A0A167X3R7_9FLAO|nr:L,D-transpeptidase family protein [Flavobacterium fryxellicola]OAB28002.1 peptidoglycan-binding protein [Flavobacterium fryxellicola]SHN64946.1 Murein L,D-transpeptidase YcbB/YkuD [Flavobacterium fryxellicola]